MQVEREEKRIDRRSAVGDSGEEVVEALVRYGVCVCRTDCCPPCARVEDTGANEG